MWGRPIQASVSMPKAASVLFPPDAPKTPMIRAIRALTTDAAIPVTIDRESPLSVLESISLPSQSVPKMCSADGARFFAPKSVTTAFSPESVPKTSMRTITARVAETRSFARFVRVISGFHLSSFSDPRFCILCPLQDLRRTPSAQLPP